MSYRSARLYSSHGEAGGMSVEEAVKERADFRAKQIAARLLRRGTTRLDVEWLRTAVGPVKMLTKKTFLGFGRDINIEMDPVGGVMRLGREGGMITEIRGAGVETCYKAVPFEFKYSEFLNTYTSTQAQISIDDAAEKTMKALARLAEDIRRNPEAYTLKNSW